MRVLLVGGGGREHAMAAAIAASPLCEALFIAPGNPGTADLGTNVPIGAEAVDELVAFAQAEAIDFVAVGPEAPLVAGLADRLTALGIRTFGPSAAAAMIEGSKRFCKEVAARAGVPTAAYAGFTDRDAALAYVRAQGAPIVVKADGLAAGKGVTVALDLAEAEAAVAAIFEGRFGAGAAVVIEEMMTGEEASLFAICDGTAARFMGTAQDHKRVGDGDTGPNTGGMGAYAPAPAMTPALIEETMTRIVQPTVTALAEMGRPYVGILYAGLMLTAAGPKLIEFNARFGDPEAQVLLPLLNGDLLAAMAAAVDGRLDAADINWRDGAALTVVLASPGYPDSPQKGSVIADLAAAEAMAGVTVFHAGTQMTDGALRAAGGRVLNVTARADTVTAAQAAAYRAVEAIDWPEGFCRHDIGWRAVQRETGKT